MDSIKIPENIEASKKIDWMAENMNKFCVLPWLNLHTSTNGDIKLCCSIQYNSFAKVKDRIFNLGKDNIEDIWNSGYMRYTRELHRANVGFSDCNECYAMEKISGHSPRMGQNVMWLEKKKYNGQLSHLLEMATKEEVTDLDWLPISLELRLGNQCNLKCLSCWGLSSSMIYDERTDLLQTDIFKDNEHFAWIKNSWEKEILTIENTDMRSWVDSDIFNENFRKMAPRLMRLYTTGGEPTLIKANYRMLQMLIDAGNYDCNIEFTSNMNVWNHEFYSRLERFSNVEIQMSIDGADGIAEYLRYPCDFARVRENISRAVSLAAGKPNWRVKCYTVLQGLNYQHLEPVWRMLSEVANTHKKHIDWWPITLYSPTFLSLGAIPLEKRQACNDKLKEDVDNINKLGIYFKINETTLTACLDSINKSEYQPTLNDKLSTYIKFMDKARNLNKKGQLLFGDLIQ